MITLINKTRRMKTYHLPHDVYCKAHGECVCLPMQGRDKKTVCSSITLPAGTEVSGLSDAVLLVPTIAKDIKTGVLQVKKIDAVDDEQPAFNQEETKRLRKKGKPSKAEVAEVPKEGES